MTGISDAYRRAMIEKGKARKRLADANKAFGGQSARLEAMYGRDQGSHEVNNVGEDETPEIRRQSGTIIRGFETKK